MTNFICAGNKYSDYPDTVAAPILRKSFTLDFVPEKCIMRVCVTGFCEVYINGKNITKGFLAPFINNPDHILYYDEYDVSKYLIKGKNAVAVILGNGFANQDIPEKSFDKASFRAAPKMSLCLTAEGEGQSFCLNSDESFKVNASPILYDMYRLGVIYDAREEIKGFSEPDYDDSMWQNAAFSAPPKGVIKKSEALPVTVQYELKPVSYEKQEDIYYFYDRNGKPFESTYVKEGWCYDFGFSRSGVCRLKIKGKKGQKITLRHAEALRNGKFNMNSIHTVTDKSPSYFERFQADTYILKGGEEEIFVPTFTYHGFRYVLVEGITIEQATEDLLTFLVFNTNMEKTSDFKCSDDTLNTLYNMAIHSDLSNFHHFPTDCPHREKCGWTGDTSVSAHQFVLSFNCVENLKMWLEAARYAQTPQGELPGVVPTTTWGYEWGNGPVWDSAIVNVPYFVYKYYGRKDIIEENADMILKYLKYIASKRDEKGLIAIGLGDWCQPGKKDTLPDSPLVFTDSSQIYQTAMRSAFLFDVLDKKEEVKYALKLALEMKEAIRNNLIDFDTMTVVGNCQTSQAVAIRMGLFENDEKERAYKKFIEIIEKDNYTINCGMIGLRNIFHLLSENGDIDIALKMITKENAPSYRDMIDRGGTALFESMAPNGIQESQNHHFYGDIINLFITKIVGININPDMKDIHKIKIQPHIPADVDFAKGSYSVGENQLDMEWKKYGDKVRILVNVAGDFYGTIVFGDTECNLQKGLNSYEY